MKVRFNAVILVAVYALLSICATAVQAQDQQSYEEKVKKWRADSLKAVEENRRKAEEKAKIDAQNAVKIAYNDGLKYVRIRQYGRAIASLNKAIEAEIPGTEETVAKAYYLRAFCEKATRNYNAAIESYKKAIGKKPNYTAAYHGLGTTYARIGNSDAAIDAFNQAIASNPNYDKSYYELGRVYADKKKNNAKAAENFRKAAEINPKKREAFTGLGIALLAQGKTQEAIKALSSAVNLSATDHLANYHLAAAYNQIGNHIKALEAAKRALQGRAKFAPALFEAGMALKNLKRYNEAKNYFTQAAKDRQWRKNAQYEIDSIEHEIKKGR